jgi:two-component system chemotaxis sensor kinase CheA
MTATAPGLLRRLVSYLVLPAEISGFEAAYLRRINRIGLAFFALHVPVMVLIAWANGTGPWFALALTTAIVAGPALAFATLTSPRAVSVTYGIAAMFMGGALVHFGQGPVQIEMHFYFFALIAILAVFGNPLVVIAAAVTVTLHHLILWFLLPRSVFNYDAPLWVVAVHAAFVVLVSLAACFIGRSFFDNVIGLERIVHARTAELDRRNRDMRLVLDNVSQGFVTVGIDGTMSAERSRVLDQWLKPAAATETFFDLLDRSAPDVATASRVAWEEVTAGVMPLALTLDQMPRDLVVGDAQCRIAYVPIGEGDAPERFLVVVTDVTAEVQRERAERDRREAMLIFEQLVSDRSVVHDFFEEGTSLVAAITAQGSGGLVALKRMLHTLKGNSAIFGLETLSAMCHELETRVAEEARPLHPVERDRLQRHWEGVVASVERVIGSRRRMIEIDESQHASLEQMARRGVPHAVIADAIHELRLEPTERRLAHFADQARRIATRLDKTVEVQVDGGGLMIDPKHWAGFWSAFIHAVRNAADHGVEAPDARLSAGKHSAGVIQLRTHVRDGSFVVEIGDDGRGIDWAHVGRKAAQLGLVADTDEALRAALFHDGVSTAAQVTDISGRGIGMGAVRAATAALGGKIEIDAAPGTGTTLRMVFPKAAMAPEVSTLQPAQVA